VSLTTSIGKNSKTCHAFIGRPFVRDYCHLRCLLECEHNCDELLKPLGNESGGPFHATPRYSGLGPLWS
jgi:hypothetical protein